MLKHFNALIDTYIDNKIGIVEHFLHPALTQLLKNDLLEIYNKKLFNKANIGSHAYSNNNQLIRKDEIYWLDREHNNIHENTFFDIIDAFVLHLNTTCFTGIKSYEFHYTKYEKGAFYKKHIDQFKNNSDRAFSMIVYLNEHWIEADGGELCVYNELESSIISPQSGKCIFFKSSELAHEVLIANKERYSITGWFKTA